MLQRAKDTDVLQAPRERAKDLDMPAAAKEAAVKLESVDGLNPREKAAKVDASLVPNETMERMNPWEKVERWTH